MKSDDVPKGWEPSAETIHAISHGIVRPTSGNNEISLNQPAKPKTKNTPAKE